jgi:hypothetical protein
MGTRQCLAGRLRLLWLAHRIDLCRRVTPPAGRYPGRWTGSGSCGQPLAPWTDCAELKG